MTNTQRIKKINANATQKRIIMKSTVSQPKKTFLSNRIFFNKTSFNKVASNKATFNKTALNKAALNKAALNKAALNKAAFNKAASNKAASNKATFSRKNISVATINRLSLPTKSIKKTSPQRTFVPVPNKTAPVPNKTAPVPNKIVPIPNKIVPVPNKITSETHFFSIFVDKISKSKIKKLIAKTFVFVFFFTIGLNLIINTKTAELAFSLQKYENEQSAYMKKIDSINNKVNKKMTPSNLLKYAKAYGMVSAKKIQYIDVNKNKIYNSTTKHSIKK